MKHIELARGAIPLAAAFALAACYPPHPHPRPPLRAISVLDCPPTQGDLGRKSAAADGKTCAYADDNGDQVTLQLVSLTGGDLHASLAPIEAQMAAEVPAAVSTPPPAAPATAPAAPAPGAKDRVDIDLPGVHIHTSGDGHADIDSSGVHVEAHGDDAHGHGGANVHIAGGGDKSVNINANEGGAQVRSTFDLGSGLRAHYILASETPGPHGFKAAWYEVRGPVGGPVVVGLVYMKTGDEDDLQHDVNRLLRRNVGG
jgi:hypothetical protein